MTTPTVPTGLRMRDDFPLAPAGPVVAHAERHDSYPVHVTRSRVETHATLARLLDGTGVAAVVADGGVEALYGPELLAALRRPGREVISRSVPPGERSKSLERATDLLHWLAGSELGRRDVVVNFGGGVVCDLGGWVASTYMRGVPYANVPTTLLAMVDGALGGKLGVNHPVAKNLLGGFQQPLGVVADVSYLRSLERRHLAAGLAECIKKAVIASPDYFDFIEGHAPRLLGCDLDALQRLVTTAAAIKTRLIERDPYEQDLRRPLNFGHTVGHPLETVTGYGPLLHGEAVAFGMAAEAGIACARGWLPEGVLERLMRLLAACGLPVCERDLPARVDAGALLGAMEKVRLIRGGGLRWVLPVGLGDTVIADDVGDAEVRAALAIAGVL